MEELIANIEDSYVKNYMEEAMSCYKVKAYRACIVLTYLALFDDIVKKLRQLATVNKTAKKIYKEIKKRIKNQEVYENYLIEQLSSNSLMEKLDAEFLDVLKK